MDQTHDANRDESARIAEILFIYICAVFFHSHSSTIPARRCSTAALTHSNFNFEGSDEFLVRVNSVSRQMVCLNLKDGDQFISMSLVEEF